MKKVEIKPYLCPQCGGDHTCGCNDTFNEIMELCEKCLQEVNVRDKECPHCGYNIYNELKPQVQCIKCEHEMWFYCISKNKHLKHNLEEHISCSDFKEITEDDVPF